MTDRSDIEDSHPIDLAVQVVRELDADPDRMARRILVRDVVGNEFPLAIWENNALTDFDWRPGQWYQLKNARGNEHRGRKSLNGSSSLQATPIEPPNTTDSSPVDEILESVDDGQPYLTLFELDDEFETFDVYEYSIEANGTFDGSAMDQTHGLAALLRRRFGGGVTHAGPMTILSTRRLEDVLPQPFTFAGVDARTLHATEESDNRQIVRLLRHLLKSAVNEATYQADRVNDIRRRTPELTDEEGLVEAYRGFECRVHVTREGAAFIGVETKLRARSRVTADVYATATDTPLSEMVGMRIEHDRERYNVAGSGRLYSVRDERFTDSLDDFGGQSLATWYEEKDRVPDDILADLREENPRLVEVMYPTKDEPSVHVPNLLRVSPRKEVVKRVAPAFHRDWDRSAKAQPDERFRDAIEFIADLETLPDIDVTVDPAPLGPSLAYLSHGVDRKDNLRFADGHVATLPKKGLSRGVLRAPDSFDVQFFIPERFESEARQFLGSLATTLDRMGAKPSSTTVTTYELGPSVGYTEVLADVDADAVLAVVPDAENEFIRNGSIDDPYPEFKKALGGDGVPSQMVTTDNLDNQWVNQNTALGLIAGAGGIPWAIDEMPGDPDCFIGLDATRDPDTGQHLGASANVVLTDGTVFVSKTQRLQSGETFDEGAVRDVIKDVQREFVRREGESPSHVVVHRDGRLFEDEAAIREPFADVGIDMDILDIRKSGAPRIATKRNNEFKIEKKGRLFVSSADDHGFIATTGAPEFTDDHGLGTPRTLHVVRRAGDTPMLTLLKQVFWLSEVHVGSAGRSVRLPITTYYADRCAEHARKGYLVQGEIVEGVPYI